MRKDDLNAARGILIGLLLGAATNKQTIRTEYVSNAHDLIDALEVFTKEYMRANLPEEYNRFMEAAKLAKRKAGSFTIKPPVSVVMYTVAKMASCTFG